MILLVLLLAALWIAGGASRGDVPGQFIVRSVAGAALVGAALFSDRLSWRRWGPVGWFLGAALLLALAQLVPLPPGVWLGLPGREFFAEAAAASGQAQPWRPWSIVPDATANAAGSLIVPIAALVLIGGLKNEERRWLPAMLLSLVVVSVLLGVLQFSGARLDNPLVNEAIGEVSGPFANRNHFALLLAVGCLVAPAWAFQDQRAQNWRAFVALGCVLLFALMILATGSRAGILLGIIGLLLATCLSWRELKRRLRRSPRWVLPATAGAVAIAIVGLGAISFQADRAVSIDRMIAIDASTDIRGRAASTVLEMVCAYFPMGSGLGGFNPLFRVHEPAHLLKPTYFNHAHNDYLEVALDAGLPGLLILFAAIGWWGWASVQAWRNDGPDNVLLRLGSAMLGLTLMASAIDYPARTPLVMALMVIAAWWLGNRDRRRASALPDLAQHL